MYDIIGIGASLLDIIMAAETYPAEDTKMRVDSVLYQCGGPCATALAAVGKLSNTGAKGISCAYLGTLSDDSYADSMRKEFAEYHVDFSHTAVKKGYSSPFSIIITAKDKGTRTIVWNRGTLPSPEEGEIPAELIRNAKILHLDGNHLKAAIYAAGIARENGVKVSIDAGKVYEGITELLPLIDYFVASEEFTRELTKISEPKDAAKKIYDTYAPEIVVVTQGKRGGFYYDGKEYYDYPIYDTEVVDSTGAGDVFHGAFIFARRLGYTFKECVHFSSAVSGLKCTKPGGRSGIPDFQTVLDLVNSSGFIKI